MSEFLVDDDALDKVRVFELAADFALDFDQIEIDVATRLRQIGDKGSGRFVRRDKSPRRRHQIADGEHGLDADLGKLTTVLVDDLGACKHVRSTTTDVSLRQRAAAVAPSAVIAALTSGSRLSALHSTLSLIVF